MAKSVTDQGSFENLKLSGSPASSKKKKKERLQNSHSPV